MVEVPINIDNCLEYCTVFLPKGPEKIREIVRLCIEKGCPGPMVAEEIVDISAYEVETWQSSVDLTISCGTDGEEGQTEMTPDGSPIAAKRIITQEELRERGNK